jgi:hypothetical protein
MESRAERNGTNLETMSREQLAKERCARCQGILENYPHLTRFAMHAGHIVLEATEYNSCDHCGTEIDMGVSPCPQCGKNPNSG